MTEQDLFTLWPQFLTELFVYLGRPSVQLQLGVVVLVLILAKTAGGWLKKIWRNRFFDRFANTGFSKSLFYYLGLQLISVVLALIFIQVAKAIMGSLGVRTRLIDSIQQIVLVYLFLQAVLAVAFSIGDVNGIKRYQRTLIYPLIVAITASQLIRVFFNSERLFSAPVFTLFENNITLSALFLITAGFYLWLVGVNAFGESIQYLATEYGEADSGSTQATLTLLRYVLIVIGLIYVLFRLNFNTTTIAAISGGLSVGAGFALSTILSNFVSGILLLFERTLRPGDIIEFNGVLCTVERITIRSIRARTFDNVEMVIPNSDFVTTPFTTYTGGSHEIRLRIPIGASYDDDHNYVVETLTDVAKAHPLVMKDPVPDVRIENFGDFSIDYQIYLWIESPMVWAIVKNELHHAILDAFADKGITIPFPTQIEIAK